MAAPASVQRYGPTTGSFSGWLGIALAVLAAVGVPVSSPDTIGFLISALAAAGGLLVWMLMLRPRVVLAAPHTVELRNVVSSWVVPLAAVTGIEVRHLTRIETADGVFEGIGVGRTVRELRRVSRHPDAAATGKEADLLVSQVLQAADRARSDGFAAGPVRRDWAVPELGVLAVLGVAAALLAVL